jgi:hypothetical protein
VIVRPFDSAKTVTDCHERWNSSPRAVRIGSAFGSLCPRSKAAGGELQRVGFSMHVGTHREGDVGMAEPCGDQSDGHALQVHVAQVCRASCNRIRGTSRFLMADCHNVDIVEG